MWPNPQFSSDLVTFTEEILNAKLHFLCSLSLTLFKEWLSLHIDIFFVSGSKEHFLTNLNFVELCQILSFFFFFLNVVSIKNTLIKQLEKSPEISKISGSASKLKKYLLPFSVYKFRNLKYFSRKETFPQSESFLQIFTAFQ